MSYGTRTTLLQRIRAYERTAIARGNTIELVPDDASEDVLRVRLGELQTLMPGMEDIFDRYDSID